MARDGNWKYLDEKKLQDLKDWNEICYFEQYTKPGMYYVETWAQRCPRNCCDDGCVNVVSPANRVIQIKEKMKELVEDIKYAKQQS